ncbi:MAG: class I SAM-dependent methyltransferase [Betaproteobacteria bacterium]|nr:class I SAM-dependent methyltransferase [Betaproteobacteria bacterium]
MHTKHAVSFFEQQFQKQVGERTFALNPFEQAALPYLQGEVLDLGCGLGNLAAEAARLGFPVVAVDASPTAIDHLQRLAQRENLKLEGVLADLSDYHVDDQYDTIVAIGILMFFGQSRALELLEDIQRHVKPGGHAVINVLIEGTTYMGMFEPGHYTLFGRNELEQRFAGWQVLEQIFQTFPAPENTEKAFVTIIARKV